MFESNWKYVTTMKLNEDYSFLSQILEIFDKFDHTAQKS
jgi:hypothetical protein